MKNVFAIIMILLVTEAAFGQTLAPATSDDLSDFDRQISQAQEKSHAAASVNAKAKKKDSKDNNFGVLVSKEAKSLKDSGAKKDMGQWVNEQRSREDQMAPSSQDGKGQESSESADSDARTSSPQNNDNGNSANAPGHTGNHKSK